MNSKIGIEFWAIMYYTIYTISLLQIRAGIGVALINNLTKKSNRFGNIMNCKKKIYIYKRCIFAKCQNNRVGGQPTTKQNCYLWQSTVPESHFFNYFLLVLIKYIVYIAKSFVCGKGQTPVSHMTVRQLPVCHGEGICLS